MLWIPEGSSHSRYFFWNCFSLSPDWAPIGLENTRKVLGLLRSSSCQRYRVSKYYGPLRLPTSRTYSRLCYWIVIPARSNGLLFSPISKTNSAFVLSFTTKFSLFLSKLFVALKIGNRTARRPIRSSISLSSSFANHSCDYTPNQTTSISVTIITIYPNWLT